MIHLIFYVNANICHVQINVYTWIAGFVTYILNNTFPSDKKDNETRTIFFWVVKLYVHNPFVWFNKIEIWIEHISNLKNKLLVSKSYPNNSKKVMTLQTQI